MRQQRPDDAGISGLP